MAVMRESSYRKEYLAILKTCSDFGFSDTEDVPLSTIVRAAFSTLTDKDAAASRAHPENEQKPLNVVQFSNALKNWNIYADVAIPADFMRWLLLRYTEAMSASRAPSPQDATLRLIHRIVTGDSQQLENLSLDDDEWRALAEDSNDDGTGADDIDVTLKIEDWLELVRVARSVDPITYATRSSGIEATPAAVVPDPLTEAAKRREADGHLPE